MVSKALSNKELLAILACPKDKGPLELSEDGSQLLNTRLNLAYPIEDGTYKLLPESGVPIASS